MRLPPIFAGLGTTDANGGIPKNRKNSDAEMKESFQWILMRPVFQVGSELKRHVKFPVDEHVTIIEIVSPSVNLNPRSNFSSKIRNNERALHDLARRSCHNVPVNFLRGLRTEVQQLIACR